MDHEHRLHITIGLTSETIALVREALAVIQGKLSAADQASLDGLLVRAAGMTAKEEALAAETP